MTILSLINRSHHTSNRIKIGKRIQNQPVNATQSTQILI